MKLYRALLISMLLGCGNGAATQPSTPNPVPAVPTTPAGAPDTNITAQMSAATLADECGVTKPANGAASMSGDVPSNGSFAKRACQESSIQLTVVATTGATATTLSVVKVKLLDDTGKLVAELAPGVPQVWSDESGGYGPWDEKIVPGASYSVMYQLSRPSFDGIANYQERDFVLEAEVSIGGTNRQVSQTVKVSTMTALPPNVQT